MRLAGVKFSPLKFAVLVIFPWRRLVPLEMVDVAELLVEHAVKGTGDQIHPLSLYMLNQRNLPTRTRSVWAGKQLMELACELHWVLTECGPRFAWRISPLDLMIATKNDLIFESISLLYSFFLDY